MVINTINSVKQIEVMTPMQPYTARFSLFINISFQLIFQYSFDLLKWEMEEEIIINVKTGNMVIFYVAN